MNHFLTRLIVGIVVAVGPAVAAAQYYGSYGMPMAAEPPGWSVPVAEVVTGFVVGLLVGAFFSPKLALLRRFVALASVALFCVGAMWAWPSMTTVFAFIAGAVIAYSLLGVASKKSRAERTRPTTFGSAEWASVEYIAKNDLVGTEGIRLGYFRAGRQLVPLCYKGARHMLVVAPTTAGKGTSAILPNLLAAENSVLNVDPKGEIARISYHRRGPGDPERGIPGMGQTVHVLDPFGVADLPVSCFNPLDWLQSDPLNLIENAMLLADAIVKQRESASEPFWDEEAKALLVGIIIFVTLDPSEEGSRHLGRVRDILSLDEEALKATLQRMYQSPNSVVRNTAARTATKDPKLRSNVLASVQAHTHFLDSPFIRASLARSDFSFEELRTSKMTVYVVLPPDRLETCDRWLRLIIQLAITVNARNTKDRPEKPVLFVLDEMAALGRLSMLENAFSLLAGFGMQFVGIVQDLSQLERNYGKGYETFVSNAGVLQYFGSRDEKTASYFSKLCGVTTVEKFSFTHAVSEFISRTYTRVIGQGSDSTATAQGNSVSESTTADVAQRSLAYPDELMVMKGQQQLLIVGNHNPIMAEKVPWFENTELKHLGVNLKALEAQQALAHKGGAQIERPMLASPQAGESAHA